MAPIYQFGTNTQQKKTDFVFTASDDGDFAIINTKTGAVRNIRVSDYSSKRYNCFDAIVTDILAGYPDTASVYFTDAAAQAIANLANQNKRTA